MRLRIALLGMAVWLGFAPETQAQMVQGIGAYHTRGVMWAHRKNMLPLEALTQGIDLNFYLLSPAGNAWRKYYRSPRTGISLLYLDLGTPSAGKVLGILPFIEFKIMEKRTSDLHIRLGSGIGYVSKKWDLETNPHNKAIGSHLNANMRLHFIYHQQIHPKLELTLLGGITHFSNGNYKMPNLGVNSVEFGVGLNFHPNGRSVNHSKIKSDSTEKRRTEIQFSMANKVTSLIYEKRIFVAQIGLRRFFHRTATNQWGAGIDVFHDKGFVYKNNPNKPEHPINLQNTTELGLVASYARRMGPFQIVGEMGVYAYAPQWHKGLFYQRIGFKYELNQNWAMRFLLKTHYARGDFFEWGVSYILF